MSEYQPDTVSPPGETIIETMQARGMSLLDLATRACLPVNTIYLMTLGDIAISDSKARCLEKALGVPAAFWMNRETAYREYLVRAAMDKQDRARKR